MDVKPGANYSKISPPPICEIFLEKLHAFLGDPVATALGTACRFQITRSLPLTVLDASPLRITWSLPPSVLAAALDHPVPPAQLGCHLGELGAHNRETECQTYLPTDASPPTLSQPRQT
jgi:hypothetical protein